MNNILTMHIGHNGAISISKDNNLIVHTEIERFGKIKFEESIPLNLVDKINSLNIFFDLIVISHWHYEDQKITESSQYINFIKLIKKSEKCIIKLEGSTHPHHYYHFLSAVYNSNKKFDYAVIMDGNGKYNKNGRMELISVYDKNFNCVYNYDYNKNISLGWAYNIICMAFGFHTLESGKLMALSDFGKKNNNLFKKLKNFNNEYFKHHIKHFNLEGITLAKKWFPNLSYDKKDIKSLSFAHTFQKVCEKYILDFFKNSKGKNILLSGGVFQNVLINTLLSEKFKKNFIVDPMCNDQGVSLGMLYYYSKFKLKKKNTYYLGFEPDYTDYKNIFSNYIIKNCNENYVSKMLVNEPVAIFQGKSEQGQRGLGNRSLLMNIENKDCLKKINSIKNREWFRPFACSILNEDLNKWFLISNNRCPFYMTFVFKCKKDKKKILKNVLSIKNTCRLQSVKKEHNINFYNLLKCFKKNTKLPLLLNTSLNMKGQTIVEDLNDLKIIFEKTNLKYIWLPDLKKIICKKENV